MDRPPKNDPNTPPENGLPGKTPLSLDEAIALALRNNFDIRSAYLQRISDRFALKVAHDKFNPHYNLAASAGYVWSQGNITVQPQVSGETAAITPHGELLLPSGTLLTVDLQTQFSNPPGSLLQPWQSSGTASWGSALAVSATQPLLKNFGFEVNRASLRIADLQEGANRLLLKKTLITTVSAVILAYRTFGQASMLFDLSKTVLTRAQGLLDINYQMVNAGRIARADLVQVESDIATRELNMAAAESVFISAQIALLELLALPSDSTVVPVEEPPVDEESLPSADQARGLGLINRPEYASGLLSKEIALKNLLVAHNNRQWDLELMAQYTRGGIVNSGARVLYEPLSGPSQEAFAGLSLSVPLIDIVLEQQVVDSQVALQQADVQVASAHNSIRADVESALRTLDLQRRILALAKKARSLATKKLDNEREKLSVGRSSTFVVLRFQDDLVIAEIAEITATINFFNSVTVLYTALGTLLDPWSITLK